LKHCRDAQEEGFQSFFDIVVGELSAEQRSNILNKAYGKITPVEELCKEHDDV